MYEVFDLRNYNLIYMYTSMKNYVETWYCIFLFTVWPKHMKYLFKLRSYTYFTLTILAKYLCALTNLLSLLSMLDSTVPPKPMKLMPSSEKLYFTLLILTKYLYSLHTYCLLNMLDSTVPPKPMKLMPSFKKIYFTLSILTKNLYSSTTYCLF